MPFDPAALAGLPLAEARSRAPESARLDVVKTEPPRPKAPFPPEPEWRVVRARWSGEGVLELVVAPPIPGLNACSD